MARPKSLEFQPVRFGKYLLLERIGRGGMAEVYRAKQFGPAGFEKEYAIKKILPNLVEDAEFVAMFIDEAKVTVSLNHPNIVQVLDLGSIDGHYFIAMEFVYGKDLLDLLASCSRARTRLPRELALYIAMEMLRGLDFAHTAVDSYGRELSIIHRDVSPSNIMLTYAGGVKVGDFGIAKSEMQSNATQVGVQKGKLGYMSPEQVRGDKIDHRSDIFAAGVILYEMLTMTRLFKSRNELDVMLKIRDAKVERDINRAKRLDDELRSILRGVLTAEPDDRIATAEDFYLVLQDYMFKHGLKTTSRDLSEFLNDVFSDKIDEEKQRRMNDPTTPRRLRDDRQGGHPRCTAIATRQARFTDRCGSRCSRSCSRLGRRSDRRRSRTMAGSGVGSTSSPRSRASRGRSSPSLRRGSSCSPMSSWMIQSPYCALAVSRSGTISASRASTPASRSSRSRGSSRRRRARYAKWARIGTSSFESASEQRTTSRSRQATSSWS